MTAAPENPDLARLIAVARKLEPLLEQLAFVGGCVTGLLVTDPGAAPVRPTLDVDAIVEAASYVEFTVLEDRMRSLGFRESHVEGAPICRLTLRLSASATAGMAQLYKMQNRSALRLLKFAS